MARRTQRRREWIRGLGIAAVLVGGLVLVILLVIPMLLRPRVVAWLDQELDHAIGGDVALGDVRVGLLTTFPTLTVKVSDLAVKQPGTEVALKELAVGLDLRSALASQIVVKRLRVVDPVITITATDAPAAGGGAGASGPSDAAVRLDELTVENLRVVYEDRAEGTRAVIEDLDLGARGSASGERIRFQSETTVAALTVASGGVTWLDRAVVDADVALDWDATTGRLTLGDDRVTINAMPLTFRGTVGPGAALDVAFEVQDTSFATLLSLVPSAYGASFAKVDAAGTIRFAGTVRGSYGGVDALPAFDVGIGVTDGRFRYPDLPAGVDDLDLDLRLRHAGGAFDELVIDLRDLSMVAAGTPLKAQLLVEQPASDPSVRGRVQGTIDLATLRATLPAAAESAPPSGRIELDLTVDGKMSRFAAGDTARVKADGTVRATDVRYVSEGWPDLLVQRLHVALAGPTTELREVKVAWEGSDLTANGALVGLLPWLLTDDGKLSGRVALTSERMDLRPFAGTAEEAPAPAPAPAPAEEEAAIVPVPTNVDLEVSTTIGTLVTDSFEMTNVTGNVVVRDGAIRMAPLRATMLGGVVTMNGTYAAPTATAADVDLAVTGVKLDLAQTVATFTTLRAIAPLLAEATGRFDSDFQLKLKLKEDGTPDLSILSSQGLFAPTGTKVRPKTVGAVASAVGRKADAIVIDGARVGYAVREGRLRLEPFTAELGGTPATVSGSAGVLDRTLDLAVALKLPTAALQNVPALKGAKKALGKNADVQVKITGTWDQPKIAVGLEGEALAEVAQEVVAEVVGQAGDAARAQADQILAAAKAEADRILAAAEKVADELVAAAKKEGNALVKEAKGNPVKEALAKEGAKKLEQEAKKAADKALAEARKKADQVLAEAEKQANAAIAAGEKGAKAATR